jgi:hypothetical protein
MAVIEVREKRGRTFGVTEKIQFRRKRRFLVKCDSKRENETTICAHILIPKINFSYNDPISGITDPNVFCTDIDIDQDEDNGYWYHVTCDFTEPDYRAFTDTPTDPEDPTTRPYVVNGFTWFKQKQFLKDKDGKAVVNSAGAPIKDFVREVGQPGYRIRYYAKNDKAIEAWYQFINCVNISTYQGRGARKLFIHDMNFTTEYEKRVKYYSLDVEVLFNEDTWDEELLNIGMYKKYTPTPSAGNAKLVRIRDAKGIELTQPALLSATGDVLGETDDPTFKTVKIRGEKDFSSSTLGFDQVGIVLP